MASNWNWRHRWGGGYWLAMNYTADQHNRCYRRLTPKPACVLEGKCSDAELATWQKQGDVASVRCDSESTLPMVLTGWRGVGAEVLLGLFALAGGTAAYMATKGK